jgi:predicted enzyme related to lactoylglutathione lyase
MGEYACWRVRDRQPDDRGDAVRRFGLEFKPHTHPIALHVEDFEAARAELESRGVEFKGETIDSGVCLQAIFEDPDGNALDIHHRYAPPGTKPGDGS